MIKRFKIPITLLFVVLAFTALFVPLVSAANVEFSYSLKELVNAGSLDVTLVSGSSSSPSYTSVSANTSHWTEAIRFYAPSGSSQYSATGLEIYSNNSSLVDNLNSYTSLSLSLGRFVWVANNFWGFPSIGDSSLDYAAADMRVGFRVLLSDGTFKYFFSRYALNTSYLESEPSFNLPALEFPPLDFSFEIPSNAVSIYSFIIEFQLKDDFYATGSIGYVMMWGGKANLTLTTGSLAEAPLYEGPDTSGYDEYHANEDALLNDTADGRESVGSAIDDGFTALAPGGTLYNSMYFWRELMNDAINEIPMLSPMITVSLAFGLVVFILGGSLLKVINKDPDDKAAHRNSERRKRGKGN